MLEKKSLVFERVVLVAILSIKDDISLVEEHLSELSFLAYTAGGKVLKSFIQKINTPHPQTCIGRGKAKEISEFIKNNNIDSAIFDDELSPNQLGNLEKLFRCKVVDRTGIILDIFAQRAQTSYARTQVELAQYEYVLPRLKGLWTHLERQRGGIGMRGPGETEIETDRRIVRNKITLLKKKLLKIDQQMKTQRSHRGNLVRVVLVGYTNVGKSTLMNKISKSDSFVENKLFATLDTTVRKVTIENIPFLLSDTVGFIRKLPTQLVESFKSTLDEVVDADIIMHVIDISSSSFESHMKYVDKTLFDMKSLDKPTLLVFNKIDAYKNEEESTEKPSLKQWQKTWMGQTTHPSVFISALQKENIAILRKKLFQIVAKIHYTRFPNANIDS